MLSHVTIYTKKIDEMAAFYCTHFGFEKVERDGDRITELRDPSGGPSLNLHLAAKSQKMGQVLVKLSITADDVSARRAALVKAGLKVSKIWDGMGYEFANLKDPSGNPVQISSRHLLDR